MRGTPFNQSGWTGGLNTIASPYELEPNESRDLLNVVSTERGAIRKRYGSTLFTASPPAVELTGLAPVLVGTTRYLVATDSTKIYSVTASGTVTEIGTSTEGHNWCVVQAPKGTKKTGGPVYLVNGFDKPKYWTGVEAKTALATWIGEEGTGWYEDASSKEHVPNGKYMVFAGNRIWMAGMSDDLSAVRFSELEPVGEGGEQADPTAWPSTNVVRFDSSDGFPITGLGVVGPYVLVFKENKIWAIHNLDTGENRKISDSVGTVSHRSITETPQGTFFLTAEQGIFLTNGSTVREMSYQVRPTIKAINPTTREQAAGAYFENHYYLSYATGTSLKNNRVLDYDTVLKSWWLHDLPVNQWATWEPTEGAVGLYAAHPGLGEGVVKAFVEGVYTDSGVNYTGREGLAAFWFSAWEPFAYYIFRHRVKSPFLKKRVRAVFFDGEGEIVPIVFKNFTVGGRQSPGVVGNTEQSKPSFPVNFNEGQTIFGNTDEEQLFGGETYKGVEMLFGGSSTVQDARVYAPGVARVWSVGWGNASSEPFIVDSFAYLVQFRKS